MSIKQLDLGYSQPNKVQPDDKDEPNGESQYSDLFSLMENLTSSPQPPKDSVEDKIPTSFELSHIKDTRAEVKTKQVNDTSHVLSNIKLKGVKGMPLKPKPEKKTEDKVTVGDTNGVVKPTIPTPLKMPTPPSIPTTPQAPIPAPAASPITPPTPPTSPTPPKVENQPKAEETPKAEPKQEPISVSQNDIKLVTPEELAKAKNCSVSVINDALHVAHLKCVRERHTSPRNMASKSEWAGLDFLGMVTVSKNEMVVCLAFGGIVTAVNVPGYMEYVGNKCTINEKGVIKYKDFPLGYAGSRPVPNISF